MLSDSSEEEEFLALNQAYADEENENLRRQRVRRPRRAPRYFFDENVSEREFREKHRVTHAVLDHLVEWIGPELSRPNKRGLPLSPRQRIQVFLHFLGTNSFYHEVGGSHVISNGTVCNIVKEVCNVLFEHRNEVIKWPSPAEPLANHFYKIAKLPCVVGVIDGTHIPVHAPGADEPSYLNRKQGHSINCLAVAGNYSYCYINSSVSDPDPDPYPGGSVFFTDPDTGSGSAF